MRVLLVEPPFSPFDVSQNYTGMPEPLALETVAANLIPDHDVMILDMRIENNPDALNQCLRTFQPQVVGVGSVTANLHLAKWVLKTAKEIDPRIFTMIGGHHVTFKPKDANDYYIDVIVVGEGDESASRVVRAWETGTDLVDIPGLILNRDGRQLRTAKPDLLDMNALPLPARHLVARYRPQYFQRTYRPIVSINTSRGCPYRCTFCSLWKMNNGKYRTRDAELVVDEIAGFEETFVDFIDDNSLENIPRANRIADLMIQRGLNKRFKMYARADTISKQPELVTKLAQAGLELALVGFEAIREDRLNDWNKRSTFEMNHRAIEILNKNKVKIAAYFLVDPNFDHDDFESLWKYVETMKITDPIYTVLVPFPGTDFYEKEEKNIVFNDYRLFDFFHTVFKTKLPLDEFYDRYSKLYEKSYSLERQLQLAPSHISREAIQRQVEGFEVIFNRIRALKKHNIDLMKVK